MTQRLSLEDVRRLRLRAQWLDGHGRTAVDTNAAAAANAAAVTNAADATPNTAENEATDAAVTNAAPSARAAQTVRHMLALQGQDWRSSWWAVGRRTENVTATDVRQAFNEGLVVRSWPMRGTLHVVAAEDIGWMQSVTNRRILAGAPKRREFLGMSDAVLDQLVEVAVHALANGQTLDRNELSARWTEAGIAWQSNWRYHLIWWLCQNGIAVLGPVTDGEPRLTLTADWIKNPRRLDGDEALAEFAARYAAARGPIQVKDLAWWSGLTVRDTKRGVALAADAGLLERVEVAEGSDAAASASKSFDSGSRTTSGALVKPGEYWCAPELLGENLDARQPESEDSGPQDWLLLPSFDEHMLGYTDRSAQLAPEHVERIVPGKNGMFLATIVHRGETVATWKRAAARQLSRIEVTPLPGRTVEVEKLAGEVARWAQFHELPETEVVLA